MKKKTIALSLVLSLLLGTSAWAKNVTVTGYGLTEAEAENDALRNAVENTMGTYVDSQTLVSKNSVLEDNIYCNSRGFVQNYTITHKYQQNGSWRVVINADVDDNPNSELLSQMARLGLIQNKLQNPRIAVLLSERGTSDSSSSASEGAIIQEFMAAGFDNMVDISKERNDILEPYLLDATSLQNLAASMQADILVVGRVTAQSVGDVGKFLPSGAATGAISGRARVDAKMYYAQTGQLVSVHSETASGVDISSDLACDKATTVASQKMGRYLVTQLLNKASGNQQLFTVYVVSSDFNTLRDVTQALNRVPGAKNALLKNYAAGRGTINLNYGGPALTLYRLLQENSSETLELSNSTQNTLTIIAR